MSKSSLLEAFEIKRKPIQVKSLTDYEIFPDKQLLDSLRTKIVESVIDCDATDSSQSSLFINRIIDRAIEGLDLTNAERSYLYHLIDNEINGFGPITELLQDQNISEIMVNSPNEIFIEIDGHLQKDESVSFINDEHIIRTVERLVGPLGRTLSANHPILDSRLKDGSRIHVVIPPLAVKGPVVTIKKFKRDLTCMEDLVRVGTVTPYMATFLEAAVKGKCNIVVCGGSSSGKTTLLNILSGFIPDEERIITIEEVAELSLKKQNVVSLEIQLANFSSEKIGVRDLVKNSMQMRPDRIVVGEIKGSETLDILQAMNTGCEGSLMTVFANSGRDVLNRLETLILMGDANLPLKAIRQYLFEAIDLVVYIERMSDGKRKVKSISELKKSKDNELRLDDIFVFEQQGLTEAKEVDGTYILYDDRLPDIYSKIKKRGINTIDFMFHQN